MLMAILQNFGLGTSSMRFELSQVADKSLRMATMPFPGCLNNIIEYLM